MTSSDLRGLFGRRQSVIRRLAACLASTSLVALAALPMFAGCSSTPKPGTGDDAPAEPTSRTQVPGEFPRADFELAQGNLGDTVRYIGETIGGGIVLVNGLESAFVPEIAIKNAPYADIVSKIASDPLRVRQNPYYFLVYMEGMESALDWKLEETLGAPWNALEAGAAFGADSSLFNALAVLSQSLGVTLVADNIVGSVPTGELTLDRMPLPHVLNALFQSARLSPGEVVVEAAETYIFVRAKQNPAPENLRIAPPELSAEQAALLAQPVDAVIPELAPDPNRVTVELKTLTLADALASLNEQTGIDVRCARQFAEFPVNLSVFRKVSLEHTLALLIRQWPIDRAGYVVEGATVIIRPRG